MTTLTGFYNTTINVDNGTYQSPLTLASTALINPGGYGQTGIYAAVGLPAVGIYNAGTVWGSYGGNTMIRFGATDGGIGIDLLSSSNLTNTGTIAGGEGGTANIGYNGGIGVDLAAGGIVVNYGHIAGGSGGYGYGGYGGGGGTGVVLASGTSAEMFNYGTVVGGNGGSGNNGDTGIEDGGVGGIGVDLGSGDLLFNSGTILGGTGGTIRYAIGGNGVDVASGAVVNNYGRISGGNGSADNAGEGGGVGVDLTQAGTLHNFGVVSGGYGSSNFSGAGGAGGTGISVSSIAGGVIQNYGTILGGDGGHSITRAGAGAGGIGVDLTSGNGTLTNHGLIEGGYAGPDYYLGGTGGIGVKMATGAEVFNYGTIMGGTGGYGYPVSGSGGAGVYLDGGTLVNAGMISGGGPGPVGNGFPGYLGDAVQFGATQATLIVDPGASFYGNVVANTAASDIMELGGTSAGTFTGIGTQFTGFKTIVEESGANWTLTGSNTLASGSKFLVDGNLTVTGSVGGSASLIVNGGSLELAAGATVPVQDLSVQSGTLALGGNLGYGRTFIESGGTVALDGHSLTLTELAKFTGGTLTGSGSLVTKKATSLSSLTVNGATWSNFGTVTASGALNLSNATLVNQAGATFDITGNNGITATGSGGITNDGTFEKTGGSGISTINALFTNNGIVSDTVGTLELSRAVNASSGHTGSMTISSAGQLQLDGSAASNQTVTFLNNSGNAGTLILKAAGGFAASISGFTGNVSQSDTIEIAGKTGLTDSYSGNATSGVLTLKQGSTTVANLHFNGDYTLANFHLATSGGNTFITDPPTGPSSPSFVYGSNNGGGAASGTSGFSAIPPGLSDLTTIASTPGAQLSMADFANYGSGIVPSNAAGSGFDPTGYSGGSSFVQSDAVPIGTGAGHWASGVGSH